MDKSENERLAFLSAARQTLLSLDLSLDELPYTPKFEELFANFIVKHQASIDRHDFWKLLVDAQLGETTEPISDGEPKKEVVREILASHPIRESLEKESNSTSQLDDGFLFPMQPWSLKAAVPFAPEIEDARKKLLVSLDRSEFATIDQRVAFILLHYPETRESGIALALRYWAKFQSDVLERWDHQDLGVLFELEHLDSLTRSMRHVQNTLGLFVGSAEVRDFKSRRQISFSQYIAAHRTSPTEIRFFLDETGDNGRTFTGVAGICAMNWRQYEKHWAALAQWREKMNWPETIHFTDTGSNLQHRPMELLAQLNTRKSGLLFVGYAMPSRAHLLQTLGSLFSQIILDSIRYMQHIGCLTEPRSLIVIKEAEPGFDNLYLAQMQDYLEQQLAFNFPGLVALKSVEAVPKGREVMLECADLIAGGMQRKAQTKGDNPKDVLANAIFNTTGFEDPREKGIVFKAYQ